MISLEWVKDYVDIKDEDLHKLAEKITKAGVNIEKIIADNKIDRPEERNHIVGMKLKRQEYSKRETYRLIVRNLDKDVIVNEIPFIIDIAIQDDFF